MSSDYFDLDSDIILPSAPIVDPTTMILFGSNPTFFLPLSSSSLKTGKDLFDEQISHLGSALIVDDYNPNVVVDSASIKGNLNLKFPPGALLSGSYVMSVVAKHLSGQIIDFDDCDIYFKSRADAELFIKDNNMELAFMTANDICSYGVYQMQKFNLIYGVEYNSPENLISRFDIRACSMAIDPNTNMLHVVRGSIEDVTRRQMVFNPVPRGISMRRYAKYIAKRFSVADSYQNLFFVELLKTDIYKPELELLTKEY